MAHPGNHRSLGSLFDRDALGPGHGAAPDWRGMIGDGPCHLFGEIGVISVKGQKRPHRPEEVFNVFGLGLLTASGVGFFLLGEPSVDRSDTRSARIRSMVAAAAQMPLEKTLLPFFWHQHT